MRTWLNVVVGWAPVFAKATPGKQGPAPTFFAVIFLIYSITTFANNGALPKEILPSVVLEETGEVLQLQGVGVAKIFFQDIYLGAFYSLHSLSGPRDALDDKGPKRMVFYFLRPINNFREIIQSAIEVNNPPPLLQREQIKMSQFIDMISSPLLKGETIVLDYVPNVGTKVTVKNTFQGIIKDNEFYNLVLRIWMGRQPPSKEFRKDLFYFSKKHSLVT